MTKKKQTAEAAVREIRRKTRRRFAPEEKIRIVLEGLRGEQSISELCRREGIAANLYFGRQHEVLTERAKIKRLTMRKRMREYLAGGLGQNQKLSLSEIVLLPETC